MERWPTEDSYAAIAEKINVTCGTSYTRSAIAGKGRRLCLGLRSGGDVMSRISKMRATNATKRAQRIANGEVKPKPKPIVFRQDHEIPEGQRIKSLFDLENNHCRWPCGEVGSADFFFCGAPEADVVRGQSYCPLHYHVSRHGWPEVKAVVEPCVGRQELAAAA